MSAVKIVTQSRVLKTIEQNPNMSARDLMEIMGVDDTPQEGRLKDMLKTLEKAGKIKRSEEKTYCYYGKKPVWTWSLK